MVGKWVLVNKLTAKTNVLVLLSGGIDSSACVALYKEQGFIVQSLFIDYGQASAEQEWNAAKAVAKHYNVGIVNFKCSGSSNKGSGYIYGRNAFE